MNEVTNEEIRKIILKEFYDKEKGKLKNSEIHMYNFPELKNIDNQKIFKNIKYLINEGLVRGGIDQDKDHSFPWITRITSLGIKLFEDEK